MMANEPRSIAMPLALLAAACGLLAIAPALASAPVPRTIVGCVTSGSFISSDGYHIRPRYAGGNELDLLPYEGRKVRIEGALLPGDLMIVKKRPRDLGPCKTQ
jgi:hypothetical protein